MYFSSLLWSEGERPRDAFRANRRGCLDSILSDYIPWDCYDISLHCIHSERYKIGDLLNWRETVTDVNNSTIGIGNSNYCVYIRRLWVFMGAGDSFECVGCSELCDRLVLFVFKGFLTVAIRLTCLVEIVTQFKNSCRICF